jgi:hypothetical protein
MTPAEKRKQTSLIIYGVAAIFYCSYLSYEIGGRVAYKHMQESELSNRLYNLEAKARHNEAKEAGALEPMPVRVVG